MKALANKHKKCDILYKKSIRKRAGMKKTNIKVSLNEDTADRFLEHLNEIANQDIQNIDIEIEKEKLLLDIDRTNFVSIAKKQPKKIFRFYANNSFRELELLINYAKQTNIRISKRKKVSEKIDNEEYINFLSETETIMPYCYIAQRPDALYREWSGKKVLLLGEQGTAKSSLADQLAKDQGCWDKRQILEITVDKSGAEGAFKLELLGAKAGDYTSCERDRKGKLIELIKNASKNSTLFCIVNELQNLSDKDTQCLFTALNDRDKYVECGVTKQKMDVSQVNWIFTTTERECELVEKFGEAFVSRVAENVVKTTPFRNMDIDGKHQVLEHIISEKIRIKSIQELSVSKTALDYVIGKHFSSGNLRELASYIENYFFNSSNNVVNLGDLLPHNKKPSIEEKQEKTDFQMGILDTEEKFKKYLELLLNSGIVDQESVFKILDTIAFIKVDVHTHGFNCSLKDKIDMLYIVLGEDKICFQTKKRSYRKIKELLKDIEYDQFEKLFEYNVKVKTLSPYAKTLVDKNRGTIAYNFEKIIQSDKDLSVSEKKKEIEKLKNQLSFEIEERDYLIEKILLSSDLNRNFGFFDELLDLGRYKVVKWIDKWLKCRIADLKSQKVPVRSILDELSISSKKYYKLVGNKEKMSIDL